MVFSDLVPRASITLVRRGVPVMGEREAHLLQAVEHVRSIKDGARDIGISYRTAWSAIQTMEQALGRPIVVSRAGGPGGGGTTLTDEGRSLLGAYRELHRRLDDEVVRGWESSEEVVRS
ncbi:MAG: winged helix-turn-helix domain-containing protein [Gemmatimonadales bacterium]